VVQSDWVCIEIGAKLGAHTLSLATLAEDGKVFAFESDTANFALLSVNSVGLAAPHATIFPLNLALWVPTETSIYGGVDKLGGRSLLSADLDGEMVEHHLRTVVDSGVIDEVNHNVRRRPIAGLRLDEWAAEHGLPRVDLVKLDVEGAEVQVIRGAAATLRRHRPILLVKYNPSYAAGFGEAPEALYEELAMRFVAIYALERDGSLTPVTDWITLQTRHAKRNTWEDLVCLPEML
jgi:FkbM family methyltransferase